MIEKWSGLESEIDLKKGGNYTLNMEVAGIRIHSDGSRIQAYEREKVLEISWKDTTQPDENYNLLIRFMPCRSDTEYCSELHLMFKHEDRALSRSESE
ncbi:Activator of Hsp90 ATPase homologue 1-like protein, partial [Aduncisulcus paluster]